MPADLVDIGVNLTHKRFRADRDEVVARALAAGVRQIVITGTDAAGSARSADLAATRPGTLFATAGVHPHDASTCDDAVIDGLAALSRRDEVVAVGECGLDFFRDLSPRPVQERWFEAQLELAARVGLPVFLHERHAHERFLAIVATWRDRLRGAVLHCFTGTGPELRACLDLDLHIGITGWICDERRGTHLRDLVGTIPADRLMIETDAPFLTPRDLEPWPKGGRNEPAFLPHVLRAVAAARGEDPEQTAAATTRTARAFFGLPDGA